MDEYKDTVASGYNRASELINSQCLGSTYTKSVQCPTRPNPSMEMGAGQIITLLAGELFSVVFC